MAEDIKVESDDEDLFTIDFVAAEGEVEGHGLLFLCKWTGYPWSECTWEPKEHLQVGGVDVYQEWQYKKTTFPPTGPNTLDAYMEQNIARYERNKAKRIRGQPESEEDVAAVPHSDDGSEASIPLITQRDRGTATQTSKRASTGTPGGKSPLMERPHARKPPLEQSSSSESDATAGSMMEELQANQADREPKKRLRRRRRVVTSSDSSGEEETQRPKTSTRGVAVPKKKTALTKKNNESRATDGAAPSRKSSTVSLAKPKQPAKSRDHNNATSSGKPTSAAQKGVAATSKPAKPASAVSDQPKRQAKRSGAPGAIRIVNEPARPVRKEWTNSDKQYSTMRSRYNAEKRGKRDLMPDFSQLQFVGAAPSLSNFNGTGAASPTTDKRNSRPDDNPYGRREMPRRHNTESERERAPDVSAPKEPEKDTVHKAPLTCLEWRNGSCDRGEQCWFLHRNTDPLKLSPFDGFMPPKYLPKPVTCFAWMRSPMGCNKSADDCNFAHQNMGLLGQPGGEPTDIDPNEIPASQRRLPKNYTRPVTCYNWMMDASGCKFSDEGCKFAHRNTGLLGIPNKPNRQIDIDELPASLRSRRPGETQAIPTNERSPITCYAWMEDREGCKKEDCHDAHWNTGVLIDPNGGRKEIDPNAKPFSQRLQAFEESRTERLRVSDFRDRDEVREPKPPKYQTPKVTCQFYMKHPSGCSKSADECMFAHKNTGWLRTRDGELLQIDPNELPRSERERRRSTYDYQTTLTQPESLKTAHPYSGGATSTGPRNTLLSKSHDREIEEPLRKPEELTCKFWHETGHCIKSDAQCRFKHYWTGQVAQVNFKTNRKKSLNPNMIPLLGTSSPGPGLGSPLQASTGTGSAFSPRPTNNNVVDRLEEADRLQATEEQTHLAQDLHRSPSPLFEPHSKECTAADVAPPPDPAHTQSKDSRTDHPTDADRTAAPLQVKPLPTAQEIYQAIPAEGIAITQLIEIFRGSVDEKTTPAFIQLVKAMSDFEEIRGWLTPLSHLPSEEQIQAALQDTRQTASLTQHGTAATSPPRDGLASIWATGSSTGLAPPSSPPISPSSLTTLSHPSHQSGEVVAPIAPPLPLQPPEVSAPPCPSPSPPPVSDYFSATYQSLAPQRPDSPSRPGEPHSVAVKTVSRTASGASPSFGADSPLCESPATKIAAKLSTEEMERLIGDGCRLDFEEIFRSNVDEAGYLDRRAFLLFHPQEHMEEQEVIVRWLLMHHVEVHTLHIEGAWFDFRDKILDGGSGIIIAHPTFKRFWSIPDFGKVLLKNVRVWSVGYQYPVGCEDSYKGRAIYNCIEIFPHGGFIYITDDVFDKEPALALNIIALFIRKIDQCRSVPGPADPRKFINDRCLLWRLAVRPELMQSIWEWCEAHEAEIEAHDPDAQARAHLYKLLTETQYIEQDCPGEWVMRPEDYWPIISERREVSKAYFDALKEGRANLYQVEQFAGTVIDLRRDYRYYSVVHTEPEKVDWQERFCNIDEIMTPEQCVEYLRGNRFEFFISASEDWEMENGQLQDGEMENGQSQDGEMENGQSQDGEVEDREETRDFSDSMDVDISPS